MKNNIQRIAIILMAAMTMTGGIATQSASAYIQDAATIAKLQSARNDLLSQENRLLRDKDDLDRQIWDLKKNPDPATDSVLNELCQKSDAKFAQLKKTRYALRQVEQTLL